MYIPECIPRRISADRLRRSDEGDEDRNGDVREGDAGGRGGERKAGGKYDDDDEEEGQEEEEEGEGGGSAGEGGGEDDPWSKEADYF